MLPSSIRPASRLPGAAGHEAPEAWRFSALVGTIAELSSHGASASASVAMRLVWEAQGEGEPVAWVTERQRCFYPPDALATGVDLAGLAVVRVPEAASIARAADTLLRSGGFGLVVLDMGDLARLPDKQLTRLLGLARKHGTAILCLTRKPEAEPSLGGLVSLRATTRRERLAPGSFACEIHGLKDKRRPPGWRHQEAFRGPAGLR